MTDQLLRIALDSPNVIDWLQEKYNKVEEYKVRPLKINNKIYYVKNLPILEPRDSFDRTL